MRLYLDSSALVKLALREPESMALRRYLRRHRTDQRVTSALSRTEVVRAVLPTDAATVAKARAVLARVYEFDLDRAVLDAAAILPLAPMLRSLDAIHVATARTVAPDLRALITYDPRMTAAAQALGLPVVSPS